MASMGSRRSILLVPLLFGVRSEKGGELPPVSLGETLRVQIVDARPSTHYQGWPRTGEDRGGHIAGAYSLSADWDYSGLDCDAFLAAKGLSKAEPVALYGTYQEVIKIADLLIKNGFRYILELTEWDKAEREGLPRWQHLVSPSWLSDLLEGKPVLAKPKPDWKLFEVGNPPDYLSSHIPGANLIDTNSLEQPPLWKKRPDAELLQAFLSYGIQSDTPVILYSRNSIAAARVAHLLLYLGTADVRVLDGGFQAWRRGKFKVETGEAAKYRNRKDFGGGIRSEYLTNLEQFTAAFQTKNAVLASVRSWEEYLGLITGYEYVQKKGEVPGAKWAYGSTSAQSMSNLHNPDGTMKAATEIVPLWASWGVQPKQPIVFYCGTSWRASEAFYFAWLLGWEGISVYDGGWYEWSSDPSNPIISYSDLCWRPWCASYSNLRQCSE